MKSYPVKCYTRECGYIRKRDFEDKHPILMGVVFIMAVAVLILAVSFM